MIYTNLATTANNGIATVPATTLLDLVFQYTVIVIGCVGTLLNGTVLIALLLAAKAKTQLLNVAILNQMASDLLGCVMMVAGVVVNVVNPYLAGASGYCLCIFVGSQMLQWWAMNASAYNMVVIAAERYVMVVHPIWHKNHFQPWMIHAACAVAWLSSLLLNGLSFILTSQVVDGVCMSTSFFVSQAAAVANGVCSYLYGNFDRCAVGTCGSL